MAGTWSLNEKYNRLRNRNEENWQKHQISCPIGSLFRTLSISLILLQTEEAFTVKGHKHKHNIHNTAK